MANLIDANDVESMIKWGINIIKHQMAFHFYIPMDFLALWWVDLMSNKAKSFNN